MKTSSLPVVIMVALGAATLYVCSSVAQTASSSAPPTTRTRATPDSTIDAYVAEMRADLAKGKVQIITSVMKLSDEEAKVFWPIYANYESELFELGDQRVDLIRRFADAQKAGKLEPHEATELAKGYFKCEQKQLDLMKDYHGVIAKELSPVRAAQFTQIEHRVATIVDLGIAAGMPLIQPSHDSP